MYSDDCEIDLLIAMEEDFEIGRVTNEEPIQDDEDYACPQMIFKGEKIERKTMSDKYCRLRIEIKAPCTRRCGIARRIKTQLKVEKDPTNLEY